MTDSIQTFEIGDKVQHKDGGPIWEVTSIHPSSDDIGKQLVTAKSYDGRYYTLRDFADWKLKLIERPKKDQSETATEK